MHLNQNSGVFIYLLIYLLISSFYLRYYSIMVKASTSGFLFADYIVFSLPIVDYNSTTVYFEGQVSLSVLLLSNITLIGLFQKKSTPPPTEGIFPPPPIPPGFPKLIEPPPPLRNPSKDHSACLYNCTSSPIIGLAW